MDPALYKPIRRRSPTDMELFSDIEQRSRSFDVRREKPVRAKIVITDSSKIQGEVVAGSRKLPWSEDTESSFDLDARFETAATRSRFGSIDLGTTRGVTTRPVRQALPFHSAPAFARAAEEQNNDISFTNANHSRIERASNLSWMDEISQGERK